MTTSVEPGRGQAERRATTDVAGTEHVTLDRSWAARAGLLLLLAAGWNLWVWATRAWNLAQDDRSFSVPFLVVHFVLFATSVVVALVVARIGWRLRTASREGRA